MLLVKPDITTVWLAVTNHARLNGAVVDPEKSFDLEGRIARLRLMHKLLTDAYETVEKIDILTRPQLRSALKDLAISEFIKARKTSLEHRRNRDRELALTR